MALSLATCFFLVLGDVGPTFKTKFDESEDLYVKFSGDTNAMKRAIALLNDILQSAADDDERLYARWRLACWQFRRGDSDQARQKLEQALKGAPKDGFITFRIHYDLGDFYTEAWQPALAEKHVDEALALVDEKVAFKGARFAIGDVFRLSLKIKKAEFTSFRTQDHQAARDTFTSLRGKVETNLERARNEGRAPTADWMILAAKCDTDLADLERHMSEPFHAIARLKQCLDYLLPYQQQRYQRNRVVELRFGCYISLAVNYTHLTRFGDARAELSRAAELLPAIKNGRNRGDLENARAVVGIEECRFRSEMKPGDVEILRLLDEAERHVRTAAESYGEKENNPMAYTAMHLGLIQELRAGVLEARGASRPSVRDRYEAAETNTAEALKRLLRTQPDDDDSVLQVRRRLAALRLKLDQLPAARKEAKEAFELYRKRHPQADQDIMGRGFFLQLLLETALSEKS